MNFHAHALTAYSRDLAPQERLREHGVTLEDVGDGWRRAHPSFRAVGLRMRSRTRLVTISVPSKNVSRIFLRYASRRDSNSANIVSVGRKLAEKSP